jgi:ankyrin repeat protein
MSDLHCRDVSELEAQQEEVYWPADVAWRTIPNSRVLTYGYDTNIRHVLQGPIGQNTVHDHAWDLLCCLQDLRNNQSEALRPVLFVAHSLGGIIVKEALRKSRRCASTKPHLHDIFEATVGFLFFGTPHRGADPRNFFHHVLTASAKLLGFRANPQIVKALMPDAEQLTELRDEFSILCHERKWLVYSFQEEYGINELLGTKVVDDRSSCLDDPTIETKRHISSNHMDMCRFSGLEDSEYSKVAGALKFILQRLENSTHTSHLRDENSLDCDPPQVSLGEEVSHGPFMNPQLQDVSSLPEARSCGGAGQTQASNIDATVKQSLVEQLYFDQIDERLTGLRAAQKTTCRWFFSTDEYNAWRDATQRSVHGGFLWIKGNPGTGKSTLMKLLVEEARDNAKVDPSQITLSFFFRARGIMEEKSTTGLYRSLLYQLFEEVMDLKDSLAWMTVNGARNIQQNGWNEEALKQTLTHAISKLGSRSLTIFVDALDECDQTQAAGMISFFEELCEHAEDANVKLKICFSSRYYPTILIEKGVETILENELGHTEDIKYYVKSKLRLGKAKNAESLRAEILEKSSGIFLWVVLVLDILNAEYPNSAMSINAIRSRLQQIPPGLNELFEMILARDEKNLEQMHACLQWVLFATRPLKPQELYYAVQLSLNKKISTYWDQEDVELDQMKTFVRASSKGLAEVTRKVSDVQFIHESVRNFLLGRYQQQWSGPSGNFEGHSHNVLRDCCLAQLYAPIHLSTNIPDPLPQGTEGAKLREDLNLKFPFLAYSVLSVLRHANNAQHHGMQQGDFLTAFPLPQWATLNNALERHAIRRYTKSVNLLYLLAENNLADLIRIHPRTISCFDVQDERYGPPFFAALATESNEAIEAFIDVYSDTEPQGSLLRGLCEQYPREMKKCVTISRTFTFSRKKGVLSYILEQDDEGLLAFFVAAGQANAQYQNGWGPLFHAAERGYKSLVTALLATEGINVDSKDYLSRTPLSYAAERGHEPVARLLVETGNTDIDAKSNSSRTPLSYAAEGGHKAIAQLLVEIGNTDVDAKDYFGRTPLSYAAERGHEAVARLLVEIGNTDVDAKDYRGQTPLFYAAEKGHEAVVRLLVEIGNTDVDAKDYCGQTPLSYAAERGQEAVARLLLENNANVDSKDSSGRTPLSCVIRCWFCHVDHSQALGDYKMQLMLLELQNKKRRLMTRQEQDGLDIPTTYLQPAGHFRPVVLESHAQEAIIKLLLERGADVESIDSSGQSLLSFAAENGREAVVRLLLATGKVKIDAKDNNGQTALSQAIEKGYEVIVKLLVDAGAAVPSR